MSQFDWIIRGGTVIDGTGAPRRPSDVGIRADRIVAVEPLPDAIQGQVIDARGLIVAPGFIDAHNHSDGWLLKTPNLVSKTTQGITTEILMSDGISYAPVSAETRAHWLHYLRSLNGLLISDDQGWSTIAEYMARLDRRTAQNSIAQIPYANVRSLVMGWGREPADDAQLRRMRQEVRRGMDEGAVGISTGMDYISQCFAGTSEIAEVCQAMAETRGIYVTHVRYKKGVLAGVQEAVEIGRRAGVPVHISHLKGSTQREADALLEYIDRQAVHEVDFSFDVYPYMPGSTMLNMLLPYEAWADGPLGVLGKLNDAGLRRQFAWQLDDYRLPLDQIHIAWVGSRVNESLQGVSLAEFTRRRGGCAADALCDLLIEENLAVLCVFMEGDDRLVEPFLAHARFMLGSDGIFFPDGKVHPRQYGSATRILGNIVRERKLFSLEQAIHKLSGFPASRFGLEDRGEVRPGAFADLVVFDAQAVGDRATFAEPHQTSQGMMHVLVNGTPVISGSQPIFQWTDGPPGRALSRRAN